MAQKYILVGEAFVKVSDDVVVGVNMRMLSYEGTMLFGFTDTDGLRAWGGHQNYHMGLVATDAELTAQQADTNARTYPIIDTRTNTVYVYQNAVWNNVGSGLDIIKALVQACRFYYNPITRLMWYVSSTLVLTPYLKRDYPFATQSDAVAGTGVGLLSPLTLKNARGSW